jgi:hypothetical protein
MLSTRHALGRTALLALFAALFFGVSTEKVQAQNINAFIQAVEAAIDKGDFTGLRSLVDKGRDLSVRTALTFERNIVNASASDDEEAIEKNRNYMNQLAVTYKLAHDDPFLSDREKWFKKLSKEQLVQRGLAQKGLNEGFAAKEKATATGNAEQWNEAIKAFDMMMRTALEYGDSFLAVSGSEQCAVAYKALSKDFEEGYYWLKTEKIAEEANLGRARDNAKAELASMKNYGKIKRPDLIDLSLSIPEAKKAWEVAYKKSLVVELPEGASGGDGGAALVPPKTTAKNEWVEDKGFKEATIKRDKVLLPWTSPSMRNGEVTPFPFWYGPVGLAKDTKDKEFGGFFGEASRVSWDGKLRVDYDGPDGKGKAKVVKTKKGKPITHKFTATYDAGRKRKMALEIYDYAFKVKVFGTTFKYTDQGQLGMYLRSQSAVKGKIRGHDVTIVDSSCDCRFNDYGEDCIIIGKGKEQRADPLGRYVYFKEEGGWYPYEVKIVQTDGSVVRSRPYTGELAPLKVEFGTADGTRPDFLVVKGDAEHSDFYFDVTRAIDDIVWVPPTNLTIHRGAMTVGSGRNKGSIMIGRGRSRGFKVETGRMNVWSLCDAGEKGCWMDGKVIRDLGNSKDLLAEGKFVKVYGNAGEEYHNFLAGRFSPTVEVRKESATGSRVAKEEMGIPTGTSFQLGDMFFPKTLKLDGAGKRGELVAQFSVKHPIFGEMVSEWLKVD